MFLTWHNDSEMSSRVLKTRTPLARLAGAILLVCSTASLAFGTDSAGIYSGSSVDSSGKVSAWGVTNVAAMQHTAYVTTTLTSPNGRTVSADGTWIGMGHSRADLYLSYAQNDLGTYTTTSIHSAYCVVMGWFILNHLTQSSTTVPYVVLTLRNSGSVSADNHALNAYNQFNGTTALGTYHSTTDGYWQTGVEIVGTVYPTTYTGLIFLERQILSRSDYNNSTTANPVFPPCPGNATCDDTSNPLFLDPDPQSDGSNGKVYDLDTPGIPPLSTDNTYYRIRVNFREYAMAEGVPVQVSGDLRWYSRLSVSRTNGQTNLKTDVTGDNVSGLGTTNLSWNLQ